MNRGNISTRIFVGGLDHSVNESDLEKAFKLFGEVTNIMVLRDKETGRSRGFAFVSFKDSQSAQEAISRMHGVEIRGRCVTVRHAEKEKNFDGGPRRGGMRGGGRGGGVGGRGRLDGASHSSNGFTGSYRGGDNLAGRDEFRGDREAIRGSRDNYFEGRSDYFRGRDDFHSGRDDFRGPGGGSYLPRARSPIDNITLPYRDTSPPQRRYSGQGYSPPRREFSPAHVSSGGDYYGGTSRDTRDYSPPSRSFRAQYSPTRDVYSKYGASAPLSPARERHAYISSRTRDGSPPLPSEHRGNTEFLSSYSRREISPRDRVPDRRASPPGRKPYSSSRPREYSDQDARSREFRPSNTRASGNSSNSREYGGSSSRSYSNSSRDYKDSSASGRSYQRGSYEGRNEGASSKYGGGADDGRFRGPSSKGRMSPLKSRHSTSGGGRMSSRSGRDRSPVGRGPAASTRRY